MVLDITIHLYCIGDVGRGGAQGHGQGGVIGQAEKATHMDLNGDGRVGGGHPPGHAKSGGGGLLGQLEKATHMDLNGDGHVSGGARGHH